VKVWDHKGNYARRYKCAGNAKSKPKA